MPFPRGRSPSPTEGPPPHMQAEPQSAEEKPRLTEEEKKQNHIASEQKRRQAIRDGFDRLTEIVPGLEGQARSEGLVLSRTVEFMRQQLELNSQLRADIKSEGGVVDETQPRYTSDLRGGETG